jgi:4,5-DOPA dioxygenase extradiol
LRAEGVLILGSGSVTHNLRELGAFANGQVPDWAAAFEEWLTRTITAGDSDALLKAPGLAPEFRRNHPTPEHLLPLFVPLGAADGAAGRALHRSFQYGSLAMSAYAWD